MKEIFSEIWIWVVSVFGGVSLAGIFTAILYGVIKGSFNKTISKLNVEKIAENATAKGIEKVKEVSFKHSIQPVVESEILKVYEMVNNKVDKQLLAMEKQYNNLLEILTSLASYFDNSIGVSAEAKEKLHEAIESAKKGANLNESVETEEVVIVEEKSENKAVKEPENKIVVER